MSRRRQCTCQMMTDGTLPAGVIDNCYLPEVLLGELAHLGSRPEVHVAQLHNDAELGRVSLAWNEETMTSNKEGPEHSQSRDRGGKSGAVSEARHLLGQRPVWPCAPEWLLKTSRRSTKF